MVHSGSISALKYSLVVLMSVLATLVGTAAFHQLNHAQTHASTYQCHEREYDESLRKSGLSAQQLEQIKVIRKSILSQNKMLREALEKRHQAFHTYMMNPNADET